MNRVLRYKDIANKPNLLRAFAGLSPEGFQSLLPAFQKAYEESLDERDKQREKPRERKRGAGIKPRLLSTEDKLLFILFYFKIYPIQEVQAYIFGMSQPRANIWIQKLSPLLDKALGHKAELPARKAKNLEEVLRSSPGLEFIIDGTERPIQRPKDPQRQSKNYSGKKKRHTVKNNLIVERKSKKIKGLSPTFEGKKHDKEIMDEWGVHYPKGSKLWKDTGFQGYEPCNVETHQPKKKPRGKELTSEDKTKNKFISSIRVKVEHAIGRAKVFHIVSDIYRNHKSRFDDMVMEIACGLHNLRLDYSFSS